MKGKTKKIYIRIKTPRKLHHAQDPGVQIKTLHLVVDIHIYIYVCMSRPTPNKNFKFSCRHTYIKCSNVCQGPHQRLLFLFFFVSEAAGSSFYTVESKHQHRIGCYDQVIYFKDEVFLARGEREREREKAISPFFPCGRVLSVLFLYLLDWLLVIVFYDLLKSQAAVERYETIAISIESTCVLRLFSVKVRKEL